MKILWTLRVLCDSDEATALTDTVYERFIRPLEDDPTLKITEWDTNATEATVNKLEAQQPITVGVLVEAGAVTEIRATHPEITLILADADTQDEDAEKAYNESRDAFEKLPHIVFV